MRDEPTWTRVCVLHAKRDQIKRLDSGHVCVDCAVALQRTINQIGRLCEDAAAWIAPGSSAGSSGAKSFESRPPINVDAVDPANATVRMFDEDTEPTTLLEVLETWERMVRDMRRMTPYGPVSAHRVASSRGGPNDTTATLVGCTGFLRRQVPWMVNEPAFPIEEFHDEMRACVKAVKRWSTDQESGMAVPCPTLTDDGQPCGYLLRVRTWLAMSNHDHDTSEAVTCKRCRVTRNADQLLYTAGGDDAYVDAAAITTRLRVDESTIRRWAKAGKVKRKGQRYRFGDVKAMLQRGKGRHAN